MSGNNANKKGKNKAQDKQKPTAAPEKPVQPVVPGEPDELHIMKLKEELEAFKRLLNPMVEESEDKLLEKIKETKEFSQKITVLNESVKATIKAMEDMCDLALNNDFSSYVPNKPDENKPKPETKQIAKGSKDEKAIQKFEMKIAEKKKAIEDIEAIAQKLPQQSAIVKEKEKILRLFKEDIRSQEHFIELMTIK